MLTVTEPVSITAGKADAICVRNIPEEFQAILREKTTTYLARHGETVCGILQISGQEITGLYVAEAYRGLGAAHLLTDAALAQAEDPAGVYLWIPEDADRARGFLEKYGFVWDGCIRESQTVGKLECRYVYHPAECAGILLDAPFIDQREKYPTGCESVSAVMALQYLGLSVTVDDWLERCLPIGSGPHRENGILTAANPWKAFPGDPHSPDGWGCFVPVIGSAAEKALAGTGFRLKPLYNIPLQALCRLYLAKKIPVILWATLDMKPGRASLTWEKDDGSGAYTWTEPMHCLLMTGFDEKYIWCNDPMRGKNIPYPRQEAENAYRTMHTQAAVILPEMVPTAHAHSAGAVLYTRREGEVRYLLVKESLGHIGLPKGHMEGAETEEETALREIREETGVHAVLEEGFRRDLAYAVKHGQGWKHVTYFIARYDPAETPQITGEVAGWLELPYEEAMETLTYQNTRNLLKEAHSHIINRI